MPGKQAKVVTPPMLKQMLSHVSHSSFPERDRAMILLSIKAGLRACEIAGLDWSMVLDPQGRVSGTINVRDIIAKKRGGRRIPEHPDLRRALERLAKTVEPVGPVIRSYRGGPPERELGRQLVRRALQGTRLRRLFLAFRATQFHHGRRPQRPSIRMQPARRAASRGPSLHRNDRTLHRRRHLRPTEARQLRLGTCEARNLGRQSPCGAARRSTLDHPSEACQLRTVSQFTC